MKIIARTWTRTYTQRTMENQSLGIFISVDFEQKTFGRKSAKYRKISQNSAKFVLLKIDQNESFIMQSGYGD